MWISANAKINWSLDITGKRPDGYHLLDMLMQKTDLHDDLEITEGSGHTLSIEGNDTLASEKGNLILKAADLLDPDGLHSAHIRLIKRIPTGAGLGGGSADAAAALTGLNEYWKLGYSAEELKQTGLKIGADVPYCLTSSPARVRGIGEEITPFAVARYFPLVLIQPGITLSTKEIYGYCDKCELNHPDTDACEKALRDGEINGIARQMGNVMETAARSIAPEIDTIKQMLSSEGAFYAGMTGSGSVVFGAFETPQKADMAYSALSGRYPVCIRANTI